MHLPRVKFSNWPSQKIPSLWRKSGWEKEKSRNSCHRGEWHCWHPRFRRMSLGWIWVAEFCWYVCPSANSIFDSLIPRAFVKQRALYQEQRCSQPPTHYSGISGNTCNTRPWEGQWVKRKMGLDYFYHNLSIVSQCMCWLNFYLLIPYENSEGNLVFLILSIN